ncbi:HipA domain-containing protein [Nannocystis sp. bb15-2]|uniref:HipA domain-containing protein n=2 Tax=Nannocystis bainbridge TaxID=2995303 RepID=A0ABT5E7C0_9BACT|nr:HipA domain-containing protein [Nannocystis bainbridge]
MGVLHSMRVRTKEVFSFEYDEKWLKGGQAQVLDPALRLFQGPQYPSAGKENFNLFLDSSPDRWGRVLLKRREAQLAREEKRKQRHLFELDFLLGVYDGHRMGALRFAVEDGPFLDDNRDLAAPPWASLRELEHASLALEQQGVEDDPSYKKWLQLLIAPGRSLGGARPKASVYDADGRLWIAKFPSKDDEVDIGAWESVVHVLAYRAGIIVPDSTRQRFASPHHTFLSRRFDRSASGERIHFSSAMTMLEKSDGDHDSSYLDLAAVIIQHGVEPDRDLEQLWRRIVFSVCVSNVDDHPRNHGFLLEPPGWSLAPAYDMNPVRSGDGLSMNISETDNAQDLELAREVAEHFRIKPRRAGEIIEEVKEVVRSWRTEATAAEISRAEQDTMADAFRVADAD